MRYLIAAEGEFSGMCLLAVAGQWMLYQGLHRRSRRLASALRILNMLSPIGYFALWWLKTYFYWLHWGGLDLDRWIVLAMFGFCILGLQVKQDFALQRMGVRSRWRYAAFASMLGPLLTFWLLFSHIFGSLLRSLAFMPLTAPRQIDMRTVQFLSNYGIFQGALLVLAPTLIWAFTVLWIDFRRRRFLRARSSAGVGE